MHSKVAGEFLHDVNAIKIAGSDIVARVRYHTEDILSCEQIFTFQRAPGRSRYKGLPEDEDGKGDVARATEEGGKGDVARATEEDGKGDVARATEEDGKGDVARATVVDGKGDVARATEEDGKGDVARATEDGSVLPMRL